MRIVLLTDNCDLTGGVSKVVHDDAAALARHGHRVTLLSACGTPASAPSAPNLDCLSMGQHEILSDPNRLRASTRGLWNVRAARELRRLLAAENPLDTIVHLHSWSKALSTSVIGAAAEAGFAMVCTLHDYFAACPNGSFYNYRSNTTCALKPLSAACIATDCDSRRYAHKLWRVVRQSVQRSVGGMPSQISSFIVLSPLCRRVLQPYLAGRPVHLIPNLTAAEDRGAAQIAADSPYTFVGRLSPEKGVQLAIDACRQAGERPRFIGTGPLAAEVKRAMGPQACSGWVSAETVAREMRAAYALLLPSVWYEAQPTVIQEAAACGIPVIAADGTAARDLVEDGITGMHFRHSDSTDLTRVLRVLRANPEHVRRMGETAYRRFWDGYEIMRSKRIERLETVYREAIENYGSQR